MGRKKKYNSKVVPISIGIEEEVIDLIEKKAKNVGKNRSEFITDILRSFSLNEVEFCRLMSRRAAQDLYYWQARVKALEEEE